MFREGLFLWLIYDRKLFSDFTLLVFSFLRNLSFNFLIFLVNRKNQIGFFLKAIYKIFRKNIFCFHQSIFLNY